MPSLENYRELIRTIKSMGVDNVSPNDKKVLMDFLKTITFMGEFKILKECYDKDEDLKKIYPLLEVKINDLGSQINVLEGKLTETGNLSEFEKVKLRALKISYNRYVEIMKAITTRNFDHYVQFMNDKINNEEQIAAICSGVLDQADVDYAKVFIINGNEKSSLDIIYDLKNQQELLNELTTYFKRKKHYTVDNEEKIRQDEQFLNYLNLIKDNEALVRTFMKSVSIIGTAENDKEVISKAIQIINSKEYDVICIYNQEYDDIMHRTHPKSLLSQRALKNYNQSYKMLLQAIKQSYQNQKTLFATITDHGVHREWYLLGNHGKNIDKDINIIHFYNII